MIDADSRSKAEIGFFVISSLAFASFIIGWVWMFCNPRVSPSPLTQQPSQVSLTNEVITTPKTSATKKDGKGLSNIDEVVNDHDEGSTRKIRFTMSPRIKKGPDDIKSPRTGELSPTSAKDLLSDRKLTSARELLSDREVINPC